MAVTPSGRPSAFVRERVREGDEVEVEADAYFKDAESYNMQVTVQEGESYIVLGSHVDPGSRATMTTSSQSRSSWISWISSRG